MNITLTGLVHIVISILILVLSLAYRNPLTLSLSFALILVFYYEYKSFLGARKCIENIRIRRFVDRKVVDELGEVGHKLIIENNCDISLPRVALIDLLPKFITSTPSKPIFNIFIPPKQSIEVYYKIKPLVPGVHDLQGIVMVFYDALGYFSEKVSIDCRESIVVLPLSTHIHMNLQSFQRIVGIAVKGKSTKGMYNLANIREYTPSDDARKILWKVYARTGKLAVREDFGESIARILVLIDFRKHMWNIGQIPNNLAQIQLRYARSLIEYLVRNRCVVDVALCSGSVPKVAKNTEKDVVGALYNLMSILPVGEGCSSPVSVLADSVKYLDRSYEYYDIVILVTNPISIVLEYTVEELKNILKVFSGKLMLAIPKFDYNILIEDQDLKKILSILVAMVESSGLGVEVASDDLSIFLTKGMKT